MGSDYSLAKNVILAGMFLWMVSILFLWAYLGLISVLCVLIMPCIFPLYISLFTVIMFLNAQLHSVTQSSINMIDHNILKKVSILNTLFNVS